MSGHSGIPPMADVADSLVLGYCATPPPPISSLPNELLAEIFERGRSKGRSPHPKTKLPFEVHISHVSRRWRDVAINLPCLWTNIHIYTTLLWIGEYLERSRSCNLDLLISLWDTEYIEDINKRAERIDYILNLLLPHVDRWSSFALEGCYEQSVYMALSRLHHLRAPALRKLTITFEDMMDSLVGTNFSSQIFTDGAPLLTHARLDMLRCCWPPLNTLTSLDLLQPHRSELVYNRFLQTLTTSQCLTRLCLQARDIVYDCWRLDRYTTKQLPTLRSLQLIQMSYLTSSLLLAVSAPQLESLQLEGIESNHLSAFCEAPCGALKFPALQFLTLKAVYFQPGSYIDLCRVIPTITHLTIVSMYDIDKLFRSIGERHPLEGRSSDGPIWPYLQTIVIHSVEDHDGRLDLLGLHLCEMISARITMRRPIQKLVLEAELLSAVERLDLLRGRVVVEEWNDDYDDES